MGKMKANRKFIEEDERAVSAVIGVILMVAITVAIAATVYVYVSGMISSPGSQAPSIIFQSNENDDRIIITTTDPNVQWEDLAIRSTGAVTIYINGECLATGPVGVALTANTLTTFTDAMISTGDASVDLDPSDFIDIEGTAGPFEDITITIVHTESGKTIGSYPLSTVAELAD